MAQPSILVAKKPWNSLQNLGLFLRRTSAKFRNLKSVVPLILVLYALCIGVGYITWLLLLLSDLLAGNRYLDGIVHLTKEAHEFVLPSLQFINGALGLLIAFSLLTDGYFVRIKGDCLYRWNIRRLPKVKYGSLVEEEKRENCCVCLEQIAIAPSAELPFADSRGYASAFFPPFAGNHGRGSAFLPLFAGNYGYGSALLPPFACNEGHSVLGVLPAV
ncbi:hypothetical protein SUGI_0814860 [Cryptomeria japonica]|nr:hypothetical protein SUGI_0814860 [Cryptomeria japonica]